MRLMILSAAVTALLLVMVKADGPPPKGPPPKGPPSKFGGPPPKFGGPPPKDPIPVWLLPLLNSQKGLDGHDGEKGKQGWPGLPGKDGADGDPGDEKGDTGDRGPQGEKGEKGFQGEKGLRGIKGWEGEKGQMGMDVTSAGSVYIHWGRNDCPGTDTLLSIGLAASPYIGETGGGTNYVCLSNMPTFGDTSTTFVNSDIVGVQYSTAGEPLSDVDGRAVACSHCFAERSPQLMIPGTVQCPTGWSQAYRGYLMSAGFQRSEPSAAFPNAVLTTQRDAEHYRTEYICVDENPLDLGTSDAGSESLLYHVHLDCQNGPSLDCDEASGQLACVVCLYDGGAVPP